MAVVIGGDDRRSRAPGAVAPSRQPSPGLPSRTAAPEGGVTPAGRRSRRPHPTAALLVGFTLLLLGWTFANPPFAAPDEWSHYLRAVGLQSGHAIGTPAHIEEPAGVPAWITRRLAWTNQATRVVEVPAGQYAPFYELQCTSLSQETSAACLSAVTPLPTATDQLTPVGNYQPAGYVLPAAVMSLGNGPFQDDRLGRLASVALCLTLLALAAVLLFDGSALSLLGLALAATPMVLFCAASLNPSGLEISAGIAFASALLRLGRGRATRRIWAATAYAGALLALSRSPGPIWVLLDTAVAVGLAGPRPAWRALRRGGARVVACATVIAAAVVGNRLWEQAYGAKLPLHASAIWAAVPDAIAHLPSLAYQQIGVFGALDSPLPALGYALAGLALGALVAVALALSHARQIVMLLLVLAACVVIPVVFDAAFTAGTGFAAQGRHVLPFTVLLPLLAGELLARNVRRVPAALRRSGPLALTAAAAVLQLVALYWNGRRESVGDHGPVWFLPGAGWSPPLGWPLWLAIAAAGAASILLASVIAPAVPGSAALRRPGDR